MATPLLTGPHVRFGAHSGQHPLKGHDTASTQRMSPSFMSSHRNRASISSSEKLALRATGIRLEPSLVQKMVNFELLILPDSKPRARAD